jgi:hypothetical protein
LNDKSEATRGRHVICSSGLWIPQQRVDTEMWRDGPMPP